MDIEEEIQIEEVFLVSGDNTLMKYGMTRKAAEMSILLKEALNDDENTNKIIRVDPYYTKNLVKVIQFCEHHANNPMAEIDKPLTKPFDECVSTWDANFVAIKNELLFQLINDANYFGIISLLELCCAKVGSMMRNKTPEELREEFKITGEYPLSNKV